jgi:alpha-tubulin suppressor-like RCC1 family protein
MRLACAVLCIAVLRFCVVAYGIVYSWGTGESGQLAHATLDTEYVPRVVSRLLPNVVCQLACGQHHSFALACMYYHFISFNRLDLHKEWKEREGRENASLFCAVWCDAT